MSNQNLIVNGAYMVEGYFIPRNFENSKQCFDRAKKEALVNFRKQIKAIEYLNFQSFSIIKSKGFKV